MFEDVLELASKALVAFGGITCVIGMVGFSQGFKDHAGQQMNSGITSMVSGGVIILAAAILKTVTL